MTNGEFNGLKLQYEELRDEINNNDTLVYQTLAAVITLTGASYAAAFATGNQSQAFRGALFLLACGINLLGLHLSLNRAGSTFRKASYIRMFIEPHVEQLLWETRLNIQRKRGNILQKITELFFGFPVIAYILLFVTNLVFSWHFLSKDSVIGLFQWVLFGIAAIVGSALVVVAIYLLWSYVIRSEETFDKVWKTVELERLNLCKSMPPLTQSNSPIIPEDDHDIIVSRIRIPSSNANIHDIIAYTARPRFLHFAPQLILVHDSTGLAEPYLDITRRFAKEGFSVMAVDLLSFQGGTARYMDLQPQMQSSSEILLDSHNLSLLIEEIRSAIAYFSKKAPSRRHSPLFAKQARLGAVGFGLGATLLIDMLGASPALTAAVAYYGDYDVQLKHWARSDVAMLLVAGSTDVAAMAKANQTRVLLSFVGVDRIEVYCAEGAGRRFFCDHESTYHAVASKEAWHKTVPWLRSNLR